MAVFVSMALILLHVDYVHLLISGSPLKHINCSMLSFPKQIDYKERRYKYAFSYLLTFGIYYSLCLTRHQRLENQLYSYVYNLHV